jgi:N-carbamoyl-L-amino-acid hydrolase
MTRLSVDSDRLLSRLRLLGDIGRDPSGRLSRLAASDADKLARDQFVAWLRQAQLDVVVDRIGNIFGFWQPAGVPSLPPLLLGSHLDTVIDAGIYDGAYGVLAALEVVQTLQLERFQPARPIAVASFTNEEGVRFAPDMVGSLVFAGGFSLEQALAARDAQGCSLGAELDRIGYAGDAQPGFFTPFAYLELHIEQGPILEHHHATIGAVEHLQGISWQRITIHGQANHAGTTPLALRRDAGLAAARVITFLHQLALTASSPTVATVGTLHLAPGAINIIPARATFTVDLRSPNAAALARHEAALASFLHQLSTSDNVTVSTERLARFDPVAFDPRIVTLIEQAARHRQLPSLRLTSGAGHDAQMIARLAPAAMIFVPSAAGVSHNPAEFTPDSHLIAGANVLLDVACHLAGPNPLA